MIKGVLLGVSVLIIAGVILAGVYYFPSAVMAAIATTVIVYFALIGKKEGW